MGVVAVETRAVELSIPADPANFDSEAKVGSLKEMRKKKLFLTGEYDIDFKPINAFLPYS